MRFNNAYFINGTAYAGKSTMVKLLAERQIRAEKLFLSVCKGSAAGLCYYDVIGNEGLL